VQPSYSSVSLQLLLLRSSPPEQERSRRYTPRPGGAVRIAGWPADADTSALLAAAAVALTAAPLLGDEAHLPKRLAASRRHAIHAILR